MWSVRGFSGRAERDRLGRYWNALVGGTPPAELDRLAAGIDPDLLGDIALVRQGHDVRLPDPDFVRRLEDDLMHVMSMPRPVSLPLRSPVPPPSNGRVTDRTWHGRRPGFPGLPSRARRWAGAQLATGIMLILVLLGTFYVFHDNRPAALPPVQTSPTVEPATPPSTPVAADWPVGQGANAARTRNMPGPGPVGEPVLLWQYPVEGTTSIGSFFDFGLVADGVLYLPGGSGFLAVDTATGRELWRTDGVSGAGVIDGDGIILRSAAMSATADGTGYDLVRISRADGSVVWRAEEGRITDPGTPVVADGVGYVPSGTDLVAFDPATGERLWSVALNAPASRGAAVTGGLAVLGDQQGTIYGISIAGGDIVWTFQTDATTIGHPALANGLVYVTAFGGPTVAFYAVDAATGTERWRFLSPGGGHFYNPAVDATTVYVTAVDGALYALDAASGSLRWTFQTDAFDANSPVLVGNTVYLSGPDGFLYAVDAASGAERWRFPIESTSAFVPVVVDGVVYVGTRAGSLYAIAGSESPTATAAAPTAATDPAAATASTASPAATGQAGDAANVGNGPTVEFVWATRGSADTKLAGGLGLRLSPDGKLWAIDTSSRFLIFDLDGNLLETWGSPGSDPGQFRFTGPEGEAAGLTFALDGSFWVVDTFNHRVQQFDKDRTFVREWGTPGTGDGQFAAPIMLAIDPDGNLLVSDVGRNDIQRFDPEGKFLARFDAAGTPSGPLLGPMGVTFDAAGRMLVGEAFANRIRIFGRDGTELGLLGEDGPDFGGFSYPFGAYPDESGYLYAVDTANSRIVVFDSQGRYVFQFGEPGAADGQFVDLSDIAINRGGTVYAIEWHNNRLQKFKITGPFPAPAAATPAL